MSDDQRVAQAGEYALGTLPADERTAFEQSMQADPELRAMVAAWEEHLVALTNLVPAVRPPERLWDAIERRLPASAVTTDNAVLLSLRRSRARWRAATAVAMALAACLALFIASTLRQEGAPTYLAVIDRGGALPALIVHVDTKSGTVSVRSLATETPADRSLQLWFVAAGQPPRSLGLVNEREQEKSLPSLARSGDIAGATLAVSVEPIGGSPGPGPTGPIVYSGQLIRE